MLTSLLVVPTTTVTSTRTTTETKTVPAQPLTTIHEVVPTPHPVVCPTPGTYTVPATTITIDKTTTVCGATSTKVPPGTHTIGGVTTVVTTATVVTCPVATVHTKDNKVTSTVIMTTYVCPSAGTYVINPHTTATVTEETVMVYPTPTSFAPGTYTAPHTTVTITETGTVYYCPFTKSTPAPAPTQPSSTPEVKPSPAPAPAAPSKPSGGNVGDMTGPTNRWAITYTPYDNQSGGCKAPGAVDSDIAELKKAGFSTIRIYATDCDTYQTVVPACEKYGLSLIIGVFVKATGCSIDTPDIKSQVDTIANWGKWEMVKLFIVANEAIQNGLCSPSQLAQLITDVKSRCSGYKGAYSTAETLNTWQRSDVSGALCSLCKVTAANIHPYFNEAVTPESAGSFINGQLDLLKGICPGNQVINVETGWPTLGNDGRASPEKQAVALKSIQQACGQNSVFFSYKNDEWKGPGGCGCEAAWGVSAAFSL